MTQKRTAKLTFDDGSPPIEFPMLSGTVGPDVVDIRALYTQTGKFTYDPGFMSTAACKSAITYIDGDQGVLLYRGYPIEQLAEHCDFLETCYLLLKGELPNEEQKHAFDTTSTRHNRVYTDALAPLFSRSRRSAHQWTVLVGVWGTLSFFFHYPPQTNNPEPRKTSPRPFWGKVPTGRAPFPTQLTS